MNDHPDIDPDDERTQQALEYFMKADTALAEEVRFELINFVLAVRDGKPPPPTPTIHQALREWPLTRDEPWPQKPVRLVTP